MVAGVLAIDEVTVIEESDISEADAARAGYGSRAELLGELGRHEGQLYRIAFRLAGPDPRLALREQADLSPDDVATISARLARLDRASRTGPWTAAVLALIAERPAVRAGDLADAARPRATGVQGRRAQAQGARAHREPRDGIPLVAAGRGVARSRSLRRSQPRLAPSSHVTTSARRSVVAR